MNSLRAIHLGDHLSSRDDSSAYICLYTTFPFRDTRGKMAGRGTG